MQNGTIVTKYIRKTKHEEYMFEILHLPKEETCHFRINPFRNRKYVFLKPTQVKCKDLLKKDCLYEVQVKSWVVKKLQAVMSLYYLNLRAKQKYEPTCSIDYSSDSE